MEQFNSIFEFLPMWHIAVCKVHHQGILKSQLCTHLQKCHKELTVKIRQDIVLASAAFQGWAEDEKAIANAWPEIWRGARHPIPHLPVYRNGFKCTADNCGIVGPYIRDIQQHCQEDHGWKNSRKRGRPGKGQQPEINCMWTEGVWYQKFHKTGNLGTPFEVIPPEEDVRDAADEDHDIRHAVELSLSQATSGLEEVGKKKRAQIEGDNDRYQFNAWLSRAGWERHLKGLNREWLLTLIRKPDTDEEALGHIVYAVKMVIWSAKQVSKSNIVGLAALNYINRREFGNNTNEKPFNTSQTGKTMDKYSHWWVEIIEYIWRSRLLPEVVHKEGESDVEGKRPPYQLTDRQDKLLRKIEAIVGRDQDEWERVFEAEVDSQRQITAEEETKLQELVLRFMLALLDHVLGDNEYHSALLSGMAVLGIDARCSWVSPLIYTPKQAAIVNISRMLVLYRATRLRKKQVDKLKRKGLEQKKAESKARSHFYHVKKMANRFMTLTGYGGEPTPIDSIQRLKAYGMKIRYTTSAEGVIDWVDDTLLYGNIRFSMPQLRSMVHGMVASSRQHLLTELMLLQVDDEGKAIDNTTALPAIHWDQLVDNPAERKTDWSFMDDERNRAAIGTQNPKGWLGRRIIQEAELKKAFIDITATRAAIAAGQATAVWNKDRVEAYRRAMKAFRRDLLALVHMTGGLPARGTELVTVQYKNSPNGDSRGIFIEDGLVVYVTAYHKGAGSSGKSKVIHRYLPREVGELMVYYLWIALPFWQTIESALSGEGITTSAYIWEPEPEKAWLMPQKRQRTDEEGSSRRVGENDEEHEEHEDEGEVVDDEPASAVELWNSNRVKYAIQSASLKHMGVKVNIMAWRHSTKAIYRKYIDSKSAVKAFVQGDEDESNDEDEAFDIQTGHGSSIGGMIYGRPITEATFSTESKRAALRRVSIEWHTFLQVPSALEAKPKRGTRAAARRQEATKEEFRRWKMMRHVDVDKALRELVGEQAKFRSVQRPALEAIMWQKSPVVTIMGTGAGKSILFMLPAFVSSGVSVVITPLLSLRENMHDRCDKLGITCVEWNSRRPHEWAQIVLVAPESAVGEGFGNFMNRQRAMGRLDRIVVDECHVVLDSVDGWRTRMLGLRNLVMVETQMVYLTATLRPSEEELFIQLMGLPPKAQCQWFRGATTRPNIQYRIHPYDVDKEEEAVTALVEEAKKKYPLPGQVIVYCETIGRTKRLAEVLDCVCYYREVGSRREKRELVMQLTSGQQQVFTATNALGLGVDAPTIRVVIHIGTIRLMRHYAQESGRAGRDGLGSEAIIMRGFKMTRKGPMATKFSKDVEPEMKEFIGGDGCMRKILDQCMDGRKDRTNCEEGEEKCQRCGALVDGMIEEEVAATAAGQVGEEGDEAEFEQQLFMRKIQAVHEAQQQAKDAIQVESLVGLMEEWKAGCQRCRAWNIGGGRHDIWTCRREGAEEIRQGVEVFNKMKKWAYCSCCYECGLPQSICESFEVNIANGGHQKQQGVGCQYPQVLVQTVMAMWVRHPQEFGDFVEEVMRRDGWIEKTAQEREVGPGVGEIAKWFCMKKRWGGIESNKMSWFICEFVDRIGR
jgi:superfamily II DNA helicase RecQ